jgi:hypothetical protein
MLTPQGSNKYERECEEKWVGDSGEKQAREWHLGLSMDGGLHNDKTAHAAAGRDEHHERVMLAEDVVPSGVEALFDAEALDLGSGHRC